AERYLVPSIAVAACLAGAGAVQVASRTTARWAVAALCAAVIAQPAWRGLAAARLGRLTTQQVASRWCAAHLTDRDLILSEAYGPSLLSDRQKAGLTWEPLFIAASPPAQQVYLSRRAYHIVWFPLLVGGYASVRLPLPGAPEIPVYPHAVDWNAGA